MSHINKDESFQIEESAYHPSPFYWQFQKIALTLLIIFLFLVLLGLGGPGLLSSKTAGNKNSTLWVEYDKFVRRQATNEFTVHVNQSTRDNIILSFSQDFLLNQYVKQIYPPPIKISANKDNIIYEFNSDTKKIMFMVEPQTLGTLKNELHIQSGPTLSYKQFIYP